MNVTSLVEFTSQFESLFRFVVETHLWETINKKFILGRQVLKVLGNFHFALQRLYRTYITEESNRPP